MCLQRLMIAYSQFDHAKAIDAADKVLQVTPNSLQAYMIEVAFREEAAQAQTDAAAKQSGLDAAATMRPRVWRSRLRRRGRQRIEFSAMQEQVTPTFYSAIGTAALNKKDSAAAIAAFKAELSSVPIEQTQAPGTLLQDTYYLGQAYLHVDAP